MDRNQPIKESILPYKVCTALGQIENIYELRLFGWVIAKAQSVAKKYNKDLSQINVQHAMNLVRVTLPGKMLLQEGDNNLRNIKKSFTLANKTLDWQLEGYDLKLNIIAFPEYHKKYQQGGLVTFVIHNTLWYALLDFSKGHRLIELPVYMRLKSKYSAILYMLMSHQETPLTYTVNHLREILGATTKAYDRGNNLIQKVLDPARHELDTMAPATFHYSMNREGRGGPYKTVTLIPWQSEHYQPAELTDRDARMHASRVRLDDTVTEYLQQAFNLTTESIEKYEDSIASIGNKDAQLDFIARVKEKTDALRARNPAGYFVRAIQNRVP